MPARKTTSASARQSAKQSAKTSAGKAADTATDVLAGPPSAFPPGFSNPAARALRNIGVTRLTQLTAHREADVAALHGMGPSGVKALKAALKSRGLSFGK